MIMCVHLCYPVSIRIYYQQGVLFLVSDQFHFLRTMFISLNSGATMIIIMTISQCRMF